MVVDRSLAVIHERGHSSRVPEEARILEAVRAMLSVLRAVIALRRETAAAGLAMVIFRLRLCGGWPGSRRVRRPIASDRLCVRI